ncbi:hypothetical protein Tco_1021741 [Tanacetum coccineum]
MEESLSKFTTESAKRHEENSNLIKEIRASMDAAIRNQGASIKTLEIQIGQISKPIRHIRPSGQYADFRTNQTTIPFPSRLYHCDEEKGSDGLKDKDAYSDRTTLRNDALPQKEKDPWSFTLPCYINNVCFEKSLADFGANVSVMPFSTYTNLGLGELAHTKLIVELADKTVKHPKGIVENVLVGLDKFVFPVDFIIQEMPEDVKVPLIFGRPFLSTTHTKIDVFKRNITLRVGDEKIIFKSIKPASSLIKRVYMLSLRERMELDLEARLMGETLILNRSLDHLNGDYIKLNDLNEPLELRRDQADDLEPTIEEGEVDDEPMADRGKARCNDEIIGGLYEYPIVEDMDNYRDDGMGDVIIGNPLCREVCVKTMRFEGIITILNGNDSVTYHMVRSHPRFKHLANKQCNKIPPLLKIREQDKMNGISHSYQKLKGFYKGILDLGPKFIQDDKIAETLTREHISVHEME